MKYLILLVFLVGCSGGGGSGGSGGSGGVPVFPTKVFKLDTKIHHYGIVNVNSIHDKTFTLTNTGNSSSNVISFGSLTTGFSMINDNCSGIQLGAGLSCSFTIRFNPTVANSYQRGINILGATNSVSLTVGGRAYNGTYGSMLDLAYDLSTDLLFLRESCTPSTDLNCFDVDGIGGNDLGYKKFWTEQGLIDFDLNISLYAMYALTSIVDAFSIPLNLFSGSYSLNSSLEYIETTQNNLIDFNIDKHEVITEWERTPSMKLKEILPVFPLIHNQITLSKNSTQSSSYLFSDDYLDSRRNKNQKTMQAQYAFLMDENNWSKNYSGACDSNNNPDFCKELVLKDVYLLLKTLKENNKMTEFNELAQIIFYNFALTPTEISTEYGIDLTYSTEEFVHGINPLNYTTPVMGTLIDFTNTCRQSAYLMEIIKEINNFSSLSEEIKIELVNTTLPATWSVLRSYKNLPESLDRSRCLPLMALAVSDSASVVTITDQSSIFNELLLEIEKKYNSTGALSVDEGVTSLILIEALEAIKSLYKP